MTVEASMQLWSQVYSVYAAVDINPKSLEDNPCIIRARVGTWNNVVCYSIGRPHGSSRLHITVENLAFVVVFPV